MNVSFELGTFYMNCRLAEVRSDTTVEEHEEEASHATRAPWNACGAEFGWRPVPPGRADVIKSSLVFDGVNSDVQEVVDIQSLLIS